MLFIQKELFLNCMNEEKSDTASTTSICDTLTNIQWSRVYEMLYSILKARLQCYPTSITDDIEQLQTLSEIPNLSTTQRRIKMAIHVRLGTPQQLKHIYAQPMLLYFAFFYVKNMCIMR